VSGLFQDEPAPEARPLAARMAPRAFGTKAASTVAFERLTPFITSAASASSAASSVCRALRTSGRLSTMVPTPPFTP